MADPLIIENRWEAAHAGGGAVLTLHFTAPAVRRQWHVSCYRRNATGQFVSMRKLRQEIRAAAREWAKWQARSHGCR